MRIFTTLCALVLISAATVAQVNEKEKQALLDLYVTTDGNNWNTTWDVNTPVKEWHGVTVEDSHVTALNLMFNNLKGQLPNSIGSLTSLETLELSFNQIEGTLPTTIGEIESLKSFAINSNLVKGTIPASFGKLIHLEQLHLSSNHLLGALPTALGNLENLEVLNVFDNNLSGTIPFGLSESKTLTKLIIAENEIILSDALSDVLLFEVDNENTRFITPSTFTNKTVLAIETSDDEN